MMRTIQEEIKQTRPFPTLEEEAIVSLARTAGVIQNAFTDMIKPYGLTPKLYNVLRILRGAGPAGLCRYEVRDRLIAPEPDVTRLLDRLEKAGHVRRERDSVNRRQVKATITQSGLDLLDKIEGPLRAFHDEQLGHLGPERLKAFIDLLNVARSGA
jgi:DNA-binding MarR family transcriptional regulator